MTRVLIVDDSPFVRVQLRELLSGDPEFTVVGEAHNGREAVDLVLSVQPDVIVMDVDMPVMDGIEATRHIMETRPTPILIHTSSAISRRHNLPFEAVRIGALDIIEKPETYVLSERDRREFLTRLRMIAGIHVYKRAHRLGTGTETQNEHEHARPSVIDPLPGARITSTPGSAHDAGRMQDAASMRPLLATDRLAGMLPMRARPITSMQPPRIDGGTPPRLLAVAASTGGPRALAELFRSLPPMLPFPMMLVQHIGPAFVGSFAEWLQGLTSVQLAIAKDGQPLLPNTCYISPGPVHLALRAPFNIHLEDSEPLHSCKPSADVLFRSVRNVLGTGAVGVLLTGLGSDGAEGLLSMHQAGATTIAQNEESAVVFGMPRRAIEMNAATWTGDIDDIASAITRLFGM